MADQLQKDANGDLQAMFMALESVLRSIVKDMGSPKGIGEFARFLRDNPDKFPMFSTVPLRCVRSALRYQMFFPTSVPTSFCLACIKPGLACIACRTGCAKPHVGSWPRTTARRTRSKSVSGHRTLKEVEPCASPSSQNNYAWRLGVTPGHARECRADHAP